MRYNAFMENERQFLFKSDNALHIGDDVFADAVKWGHARLNTLDNQKIEQLRLQEEQPDVYAFLNGMWSLRRNTMIGADQADSYTNGSLFMLKVVENYLEQKKRMVTKFSGDTFLGYFNDLINIEINHYEIERLKKDSGISTSTNLYPSSLSAIITAGKANPIILERVLHTFTGNSIDEVECMLKSEPPIAEALSNDSFSNTFGYGFSEGLKLGMTDIYAGIRKAEDTRNLNKILQTRVRFANFDPYKK